MMQQSHGALSREELSALITEGQTEVTRSPPNWRGILGELVQRGSLRDKHTNHHGTVAFNVRCLTEPADTGVSLATDRSCRC
jgi:hypothetical protein